MQRWKNINFLPSDCVSISLLLLRKKEKEKRKILFTEKDLQVRFFESISF